MLENHVVLFPSICVSENQIVNFFIFLFWQIREVTQIQSFLFFSSNLIFSWVDLLFGFQIVCNHINIRLHGGMLFYILFPTLFSWVLLGFF